MSETMLLLANDVDIDHVPISQSVYELPSPALDPLSASAYSSLLNGTFPKGGICELIGTDCGSNPLGFVFPHPCKIDGK